MDIVVSRAFTRKTRAECVRLLGNVRQYVHDDEFVAIVTAMDLSNPLKVLLTCRKLAAFNSREQLWGEVDLWLGS